MLVTICNNLVIDMKYISKKREKSILAGLLTFIMIFTMSFAFFDISSEAVSKSELNALKQQQEQLASKKTDLQAQSAAISSFAPSKNAAFVGRSLIWQGHWFKRETGRYPVVTASG